MWFGNTIKKSIDYWKSVFNKKTIKIKFHTKNRQKKDELFSIGIDGLMLAIDKYNPNKGLSFSSYAISKIIFHFIDIFFWFIWWKNAYSNENM